MKFLSSWRSRNLFFLQETITIEEGEGISAGETSDAVASVLPDQAEDEIMTTEVRVCANFALVRTRLDADVAKFWPLHLVLPDPVCQGANNGKILAVSAIVGNLNNEQRLQDSRESGLAETSLVVTWKLGFAGDRH